MKKNQAVDAAGIVIRELYDAGEKTHIARIILEALTDWFGVGESREAYIAASADLPFFAAYAKEEPVGFLSLKETGRYTTELAVMGILRGYHHRGIGTQLFNAAKAYAVERGYRFLQVKTVCMGMYEDYDATNRFYQSLGFVEFEVIPELWGDENPCQIYVMSLEK